MILFLRPQKWSQAQQHSALPLLKLAAGAHRPPSLVSKKDPTILVIRYHLGLHTHLFLSTVPYAVDRTVKEVQVLGKCYIIVVLCCVVDVGEPCRPCLFFLFFALCVVRTPAWSVRDPGCMYECQCVAASKNANLGEKHLEKVAVWFICRSAH